MCPVCATACVGSDGFSRWLSAWPEDAHGNMESGRRRSLPSLLADFGLPAEADASALHSRYRALAKQRHPDMVATKDRRSATKDFALLHSRYQEALILLEQRSARRPSSDDGRVIRTHNGLFYHDPYKWSPPKSFQRNWQHEAQRVPQASLATKMKGLALAGSSIATLLYVFDRTARKRSLSFWSS